MFGTNPIRKLTRSDGQLLTVQDIFDTIQGEGPYAGMPATFVRLWGCMLKCNFCDTDFESNPDSRDIADIVSKCHKKLVVITGGEPLRQNLVPLIDLLWRTAHSIQIETAGSFDLLDAMKAETNRSYDSSPEISVVVSPKTAYVNPGLYPYIIAWKYVISAADRVAESDGLPIVNFQKGGQGVTALARPPAGTPPEQIWLQPMDEQDQGKNRANQSLCVTLAMKHGYRVSLQQHKILNLP